MKSLLPSLATAIAALGFLNDARAQTTTLLQPSADTHLQSSNPSSNFGSSADLWMGRGDYFGLGNIRTLVRFDLASLPQDARQIRSARLAVYQYDTEPAAGGITTELHHCTSAWTENGASWNQQPSYDSRVWSSARVGDSFYRGWIEWDVADLVREQVSGAIANEGWLLRVQFETAGISRLGYMHSRESTAGASLLPKLEVESYELLLEVGSLVAGQPATATVSGLTPGGAALIFYSTSGLGSTAVGQLGVELEILNPQIAAQGRANNAGIFPVTRTLPAAAAGQSGWLQAASHGKLSNLLVVSVL